MEFTVSSVHEKSLSKVILTDAAGGAQVIILPQYGAMLHSFVVQAKKGLHNIIDNYDDAAALKKELSTSFKSSKLSPFACRIPEGKYDFGGKEFEFQTKFMDGTAIHGLLYNKAFEQTGEFFDADKASATFKYVYNKEDDGYPFQYGCEVTYTLLPKNTLRVQTSISNLDVVPIPMTDGWHPYFALGGNVNDWLLYFHASNMVEFDERLVPTGRLLPYNMFNSARLIADTQLDNCFLLNSIGASVACTLRNEGAGIQLSLFPDESYPYLQIYIPPERRSIAIENLSGAPNAFNNKMGLMMLTPGHQHTFTVSYQVDC